MDKILSLVISALAMGFIVWWFFGKRKESAQMAEQANGVQHVEITVDGGYQPRVVQLRAGVTAKLIFTRKDPSACLEEVLMPDFGVAKTLPVGEPTLVEIKAPQPGEYKFTCGMQMFSGQVVVK
jgi:plastocyanin domain-containing protein